MNRPDVVKQPLGVTLATFAVMMACVMVRVTTAPGPAETALGADMPLGRAIDSLFRPGIPAVAVSLLAAFLNATLLAGMIVRYSVSAVRTYLPMTLYAMAAYGICFPAGSVSAALAPLLLTAGSTQIIAAFKRSYQFEHVFKSAFCIGLLPMLYAPATLLVPIVPITLSLYRRTPREAAVAAVGLLLPLLLCSVVWWMLGSPFGYMADELIRGIVSSDTTPSLFRLLRDSGVPTRLYAALYGALTLYSVFVILRIRPTLRTRAGKIYVHFLWLLLVCLLPLLLPGGNIVLPGLPAIPCGVIVTAFFIRHRGWIPLAIYLAMVALMLYINLFPAL